MRISQVGRITLPIAAALVLLTTYLAIFYAPLPTTSVAVANEIMPTLEGSDIKVAGFVTNLVVKITPGLDASDRVALQLADFVDYERYEAAAQDGDPSDFAFTVKPIDVLTSAGGWLGHIGSISNGTNISVSGYVVHGALPILEDVPYWDFAEFWIRAPGPQSVEIGSSAGSFSISVAPIDQKIFFFHMPSAWVCFLAFSFTLVFGALYLRTRNLKFDKIASSAAEIGIVFATIAITTGPVWAKEEWGVYWRWDDTKLVTTFILWLVYIGYLMLRASISEPSRKARVSAVYGILGFVTVPMSLLSSRIAPLLSSSHPQVIASSQGSLSPEAGLTIGVAVLAFTFLFITMLIRRVEIADAEEELEETKRLAGGEE